MSIIKVLKKQIKNEEKVKNKFNNYNTNSSQPKTIRSEPLKKIYESPKTFLRKPLEVIEVSVEENLTTIFTDYTEWRRGKAKKPEYIFNMLKDISFVSILPKIVHKYEDTIIEHAEEFSEILSSAVVELTRNRIPKASEMISVYTNIYEDLNETRIEKIMRLEVPGIDWKSALFICMASHGSPRHTMTNTLNAIYRYVETTSYKIIRRLLVKLYGKEDMDKVAVAILLERSYRAEDARFSKNYREMYSVITNIALDQINHNNKVEVVKLLKTYCEERRKSEYDKFIRRRVTFNTINKEDYSKIHKAIKKLAKKNEMYRIFLDKNVE